MPSFEFEVRGVREKYPHNEFRSGVETRGKPLWLVDLAAIEAEQGVTLVRGDLFLRMTDAGEFDAGQRYRVTLERLEDAPAEETAAVALDAPTDAGGE